MTELLNGGDTGGRLLADLALRLRQLLAHPVQPLGQFGQLVTGADVNRALQVAGCHTPNLLHELPQGSPHEPKPQNGRQYSAEQHHLADQQGRPADDVSLLLVQFGQAKKRGRVQSCSAQDLRTSTNPTQVVLRSFPERA